MHTPATTLHFAPLQGYADHYYRRYHTMTYGAADAYYTPFIRIEKGMPRKQDMARLEASVGDGTNLVPQIIFGSALEFQTLTDAVKEAGYDRIDLNLGCPFPMQTRKGRGAAMIGRLDAMREISALINADEGASYSIKMRLGMENPAEWRELLPMLNDTKLACIALHPRVATQMYDGELLTGQFDAFASECAHPLIWNGDVKTREDIARIAEQYPSLKGIMIGRGFLARPSLGAEWKEGRDWSQEDRLARLKEFHALLIDTYEETLCGQTQILQKIKPFWDYLEPEIGHKAAKAIKKATSVAKYRAAIDAI